MQSIFNKHVAFLLCFVINTMHLYECATQINIDTNNLPATLAIDQSIPIVVNGENETNKALITETPPIASITNTSRQLRKVMMMGNYRSSYVGGTKSNRRLPSSINQYQVSNTNRQLIDGSSLNVDVQTATATVPTTTKTKKKQLAPVVDEFGDEIKYKVGPGVHVGIEKKRGLVSLYLDEDCLKDVLTGRGKKQDLITKILPLFILPFLIQSAVVPFLVSTLKLLLIKSIVVGKIAIFLLLFSAFKNHVKYAYDAAPSYYSDLPNRRTEALIGYRVEGKPAAWVN